MEVILRGLSGMLCGPTDPLLGLLRPLGPGEEEGFLASTPGLGDSVLGQAG